VSIDMPAEGSLEALAAEEDLYLMHTFKRLPVEFVRGERWHVYDTDGRQYLDFVAGLAVNSLGHGHPRVIAAIERQARLVIHTSDLYYSRPQVDLARKLNQLGFKGRAFYNNSGAEANETAIKVARKWGKANRDGAYEVITASAPAKSNVRRANFSATSTMASRSDVASFSAIRA